MEAQHTDYDQRKRTILSNKARDRAVRAELDGFDPGLLDGPGREVRLSDVTQVGSKILIGGGLGVLAGVGTIAVAASAAEVIIAGVVTKIAGVIGCAVGLSLGVNKFKKTKTKS